MKRILDSHVALFEKSLPVLASKAWRLKVSMLALAVAAALTAGGFIVG